MKKLMIALALLFLAVWLGIMILKDPGYVLISYDHWSIETSLWISLFIILLIVLVIHFLLGFSHWVGDWRSSFHDKGQIRLQQKAYRLAQQGWCDLIEENWSTAEKKLAHAGQLNADEMAYPLACAWAAHSQQHDTNELQYIKEAQQKFPDAKIAIGLLHAQWKITHQQWDPALKILQDCRQSAPKHPLVLKNLAKVYSGSGDWLALQELLPKLYKQKILNDAEITLLSQEAIIKYFAHLTQQQDYFTLINTWENLSASLQNQLAVIYCQHLIALQKTETMAKTIENILKKNWNADLLDYYGKTPDEQPQQKIANAQIWLKKHPADPQLLLCLGRLSAHVQAWEQARGYLVKSIQYQPLPASYYELGQVLEVLGLKDAALAQYRNGLLRC